MRGVWLHAALFAAGAFGVLAHAPFHFQPALIGALVLLVWSLDDARRSHARLRAGFARAWSFAAGQFLGGTWWVANAFLVSAGDHAWLIWAPLILLPGGLALFWGAAGAAYARFAPRGAHRIALFAALFTAVELLRSSVLSGFPWNLPGHVFPAGDAMSQSASLIGAAGLSALVLYAFAAPAALTGPGRAAARAVPLAIGLALMAGLYGYGALRLDGARIETSGEHVRVVQINMPQSEKRHAARFEILDRFLELTLSEGLEDVDAVIWPEGAIPAFLLNDDALLRTIHDALPAGVRLWTGTARADFAPPGGRDMYYNALAALLMGEERIYLEATYDKARLVPFGESNPLRPLTALLGFETLAALSSSYDPGPGPRTLQIGDLSPFAPLICYEVIFPRFAPRETQRPAWLLNISNDSWYGNSAGPRQHLNQARYRAVEEGLPLVRSASSGVSGLVDPYGREVSVLPLEASAALDIPLLKGLDEPFYALYGNTPWLVAMAMFLLLTERLASILNASGRGVTRRRI